MRPIIAAVVCIALASCGSGSGANEQSPSPPAKRAAASTISLTSEAFAEGQPIPARFTCDGINRSPALAWTEPPAGTKSFALVVGDPDAPSGTFRHWGAFDIPNSARGIGAGQQVGTQVQNDMGKPGYGGPCPPKGHGPHHYHFKLFALDVDKLGLSPNAKVADVENAAQRHAITRGELVGTFERK